MLELNYILRRNKSNIKKFCDKNRLTSYDLLLEYCGIRQFIPCTEEEYNEANGLKINHEEKVERKTRKTQKRKTRARSKGKQAASKLPKGDDNG